jgi:UDP-N-acetylmuramate--alanine ligase
MTEAIKSFKGVKRRFEYLVKTETHRVIDDYAHHPEELQTAIASVRELYPNTRVSGIFQPHLFSRTRDFAEEFARVLGTLDQLWLLEIYPAREKPIPGINATYLKSLIRTDLDVVVISKEELIETLQRHKPETLIILGAGDIDTLRNPIMNIYE